MMRSLYHGGDDADEKEQVREEEDDDGDDGDGDVNFVSKNNARWRMMVMTTMYVWLHSPFSIDVVYMNTNLNAISKIHQGIDGINVTKDFIYKMPDVLTKQISTKKASNMHILGV